MPFKYLPAIGKTSRQGMLSCLLVPGPEKKKSGKVTARFLISCFRDTISQ
jgi:hypothetical protein